MTAAILRALWRALPYLVAVAIVGAALWFVYSKGVGDEHERRVAEVTALNSTHEAELSRIDAENNALLAKLTAEARAKEAADAKAMAELDQKHTKEMKDAKAEAQRTIDGLRSGAVRLRSQYACTPGGTGSPASGVPKAGTSTGMGDGATGRGFGIEDATAVFGAADEGDGWARQLLACQAIVRMDRGQ